MEKLKQGCRDTTPKAGSDGIIILDNQKPKLHFAKFKRMEKKL